MGVRPAAMAAWVLAWIRESDSWWSWRRSEWPRMTQEAPESRSMAAEMSPVWAPLSLTWQSWPPTATGDPARIWATAAIWVKGGQTSRSQVRPVVPARRGCAIAAASAVRPFIFQLPAISWGILGFLGGVGGIEPEDGEDARRVGCDGKFRR